MRTGPAHCKCPQCGSVRSLPLFWGYPGDLAQEAGRQGLIAFGGCMIDDAHLNRKCCDCSHRWEDPDAPVFDWSTVKPVRPWSALWRRLRALWQAR
ncbi:hypothetical protein ACFPOU_02760 [Massilia jejuensis]|uniref:Uncharacterized protein n=1 Tax=Massilia jejuensis TaxID=648894 RepID=A0ABW0PET4_9BURK